MIRNLGSMRSGSGRVNRILGRGIGSIEICQCVALYTLIRKRDSFELFQSMGACSYSYNYSYIYILYYFYDLDPF